MQKVAHTGTSLKTSTVMTAQFGRAAKVGNEQGVRLSPFMNVS